jgi:hypothetical protein
VDQLWSTLAGIAAVHEDLTELNTLRMMETAFRGAEELIAGRTAVLAAAPPVDDLARIAARAQVKRFEDASREWQGGLGGQMADAKSDVLARLRDHARHLDEAYQNELRAKIASDAIPAIEARFITDLIALQQGAVADVREEIRLIVEGTLTAIPGADAVATELAAGLPDPRRAPTDYLRQRPPPVRDARQKLGDLGVWFSGSNMAKMVLHAVKAIGLFDGIPLLDDLVSSTTSDTTIEEIAMVGGAAWMGLNRRVGNRVADVAGLKTWVTQSINDTKTEVAADVDTLFRRAQTALTAGLKEAFDNAIVVAKQDHKELDDARRAADNAQLAITKARGQLDALKTQWETRRRALQPGGGAAADPGGVR